MDFCPHGFSMSPDVAGKQTVRTPRVTTSWRKRDGRCFYILNELMFPSRSHYQPQRVHAIHTWNPRREKNPIADVGSCGLLPPEDAASADAAPNGGAQIKAEQKCWGYHARTTKIDAERVRQRARERGSRCSVMCLVKEQANTADGHGKRWKTERYIHSVPVTHPRNDLSNEMKRLYSNYIQFNPMSLFY